MAELENDIKRNEEIIEDTTVDYVEAIKDLKQNTVDKAKYDALRLENKKLIQSLVDGQTVENPFKDNEVQLDEEISQLRKDLFSDNTTTMTNLDYWTKTLKLREDLLKKGEIDPFVPQGNKVSATQADYDKAEKVATIMQEMVDNAEGDPNVFLNEYQRRVKDTQLKKK